ncbi:MAG: helix-turn-helix domain-containing protein [Defluviitaleaceae bacterium]|nr:helix-turn-helix domain-containing protein [Defluviitaleaceae bacterium]
MNMGRRILQLRVNNGLSQESFAELLGVTRQSISKWELDLAVPDAEKIIKLSKLFGVTTDWLLLNKGSARTKLNAAKLRFSMYLIVKDFGKSVSFYQELFQKRASVLGSNRFAQFFIDGICFSIMNEGHLPGHDYTGCGDHKFALNLWTEDLNAEHKRLRLSGIGQTTDIILQNPNYLFFNVYDPDNNVVEITGNYIPNEKENLRMSKFLCESCGSHFPSEGFYGNNADGTTNEDYCKYCWVDGKFGKPNETLEEMVESCVPFMVKSDDNPDGYPDADAARQAMKGLLPNLKRWKNV